MRIGIDFDNTIVNTKQVVNKYLKRHNFVIKKEEDKTMFYEKYIDEITKELKPFKNSLKILNKLSNHELYLISARSTKYSLNSIELVKEILTKYNFKFKEIYFGVYGKGKAEVSAKLGIELFIDDDITNCLEVSSVGIDTILYGKEYEGLKSKKDWKEIYKYIKGD